jgi:hypothetical protein
MAKSFANLVVETSSTTGTGTYSLAGVPAGSAYRTFRQEYSNGETKACYVVRNADFTKWEINRFGTLTYGTPDLLSRNVLRSTNSDAAVSWVSGDLPLTVYVSSSIADVLEMMITGGLGASQPGYLRYGLWFKDATPASGYQQANVQDGSNNIPVGIVNATNHDVTLYGMGRGHIDGLITGPNAGTPTTKIDVAAGECIDSTNAAGIKLSSALTKRTGGSWAVGNDANGMGQGLTVANSTWYHIFAILNAGVPDVYFDTSISAANKPSGTTHFRRIGSFLTDGSAHIVSYLQIGDEFLWSVPVNSYNNSGGSPFVATVPTGLSAKAFFNALATVGSAGARNIVFYSPLLGAQTANSPSGNVMMSWGAADQQSAGQFAVWTDTSGQIAFHADNTTNLWVTTTGWLDSRGRNA